MNRRVKDFVVTALNFDVSQKSILEIGSRQMSGQEESANLRPYLMGKKYVGMDYLGGPGVDVVMDVHEMEFEEKFDIVICAEVLEHVSNPFRAMEKISKVVTKDGILVLTAPMNLKIHGSPFDYWRFTPQGFDILLSEFEYKYITFAGRSTFPMTICAIASKSRIDLMILDRISSWEKKYTQKEQRNKFIDSMIINLLPPIFWGSNYEFWIRREKRTIISFLRLFIPNILRLKWTRS
jgi:SAM-dependent methyltransferase